MLSRFHLIPERNGQTDGRTDRFAISISVCWRAIKTELYWTQLNWIVQFSSVSRCALNRRRPATICDDSATKLADVAGSSESGHTLGQSTQCLSLHENGRRAATTGDGRSVVAAGRWFNSQRKTELNWTERSSSVELSWVQFSAVHWV